MATTNMSEFVGRWSTTFGILELTQIGTKVKGTYFRQEGIQSSLEGEVTHSVLRYRYQGPNGGGEGWFRLTSNGKISGQWRPDGADSWGTWEGERDVNTNKKVILAFTALFLLVGIVSLIVVWREEGLTVRLILGMVLGMPWIGAFTGLCFALAFAPRGFFERQSNKRFFSMIGTENVIAARLACFLVGSVVLVTLAAGCYSAVTSRFP
jgi:hypothetical protein